MTIAEEKFKHGFVISQIALSLSELKSVRINVKDAVSRGGYVFEVYHDGEILTSFGLFIKTSRARGTPWRYTFSQEHQEEIKFLFEETGEVFIAFVNNDDGVSCVGYSLFKQLLDNDFETAEWVTVSRKFNKQYSLSGNDGVLEKKIARNDFPDSISIHVYSLILKKFKESLSNEQVSILRRIFGTES